MAGILTRILGKGIMAGAVGCTLAGAGLLVFRSPSVPTSVPEAPVRTASLPGPVALLPAPASLAPPAAPEPLAVPAPVPEPATETAGATDCAIGFTAVPRDGALVRLALSAPCHGNAPVEIAHGPLAFDVTTDASGAWSGLVPVLAETAVLTATLGDAEAATETPVPDFDSYARVVLQSANIVGLSIHALEYGARHGTEGHIWSGAPGSPERAVRGRGGFLLQLGDGTRAGARRAEVYIFPAGLSRRSGAVRLSVEAQILETTCDRPVAAQVLQPGFGGGVTVTEISIDMPPCEGIGDILVLKNILRDLKIASN